MPNPLSQTRFRTCENCHLTGPLYSDGEPMDIRARLSKWGDVRALCYRCGAAVKIEARERTVNDVFTKGDRELLKEMGISLEGSLV